jgi:hypothetical protein
MKWVVAGLGCIVGLLGGACTSSDGGSSGAPLPLDQLPQQFAASLCDGIEPCCKADDITYSASKCKQQATEQFTAFVTQNNGAKYDAQAGGDCLRKLRGLLKSCSAVDGGQIDSVCAHLFVGTLPQGATCQGDGQCQSGYCAYDSVSNLTVCTSTQTTEPAHAKLGEGCAGQCYIGASGNECGLAFEPPGSPTPTSLSYCYESDGLFCSFQSSTCQSFAAIGNDCSNAPCAKGGFCSLDASRCTAQYDSGPCNGTFGAGPEACSDKSYCELGQCLAKKPDGYACQTSAECKSGECNAQGSCGVGSAATEDSCSGKF